MNIKLSIVTRAVTVLLIVAFFVICISFFPNFVKYIDVYFIGSDHLEAIHTVIYAFGALVTLPCLVMLFMALGLSSAVENDRVFTRETAALLSRISMLLFIDCIVFLLAVIALFAIGELTVSPLLALIDLVGYALAVLLRVLSGYIRRAAELKEEADATL